MKRLLSLVIALAVAAALTLIVAPLAFGAPDRNKPTTSDSCPNVQYGIPVPVTDLSAADDVNGDSLICAKTVGASGKASEGPQYIDNTAHNQNG